MAAWKEDIVKALEELGGIASYPEIYNKVQQIRQIGIVNWQATIRGRIEDLSSDSERFKNGEDLFYSVEGLGKGVWGLRARLRETPRPSDIEIQLDEPAAGGTAAQYVPTTIYRILRDTIIARKIKILYNHKCQICGNSIQLSDQSFYSEAHHIIPLGRPHFGPDQLDNIIVLCPNHHVLCDYGVIPLIRSNLMMKDGHVISDDSLNYHNAQIFEKVTR